MTKETSKDVASIAAELLNLSGLDLVVLSGKDPEALAAKVRAVAASALVQTKVVNIPRMSMRDVSKSARRGPKG